MLSSHHYNRFGFREGAPEACACSSLCTTRFRKMRRFMVVTQLLCASSAIQHELVELAIQDTLELLINCHEEGA